LDSLREGVTQRLAQIEPMSAEQQQAMMEEIAAAQAAQTVIQDNPDAAEGDGPAVAGFDENNPETWGNPGRNDMCPCGSGKKFKHCHGKV